MRRIESKQSGDDDSRAFSRIAPSDRDAFRFATIGLNLPEDEAWFATWHLMAETRAFLEELNYAILEGTASGDKWVLLQTTDIEREFKAICSSSGGSRARLVLCAVASTGFGFLAQCSNLTAIDLSGLTALTSIGDGFLADCLNLTAVDLSGLTAVTSIGLFFLFQCSNLTAVDLSGLTAVASIGDQFLAGCSNLTAVDLSGLTAVASIGHCFLSECSPREGKPNGGSENFTNSKFHKVSERFRSVFGAPTRVSCRQVSGLYRTRPPYTQCSSR